MANHSYVQLNTPISGEGADLLLRDVVKNLWDGRLVVESYEGPDTVPERLSWDVSLPNSALPEDRRMYWKGPGEDFGFVVWYHTDRGLWEFRHPPNGWERWAQDKVQQTIAHRMGILTYRDDGSGEPLKVDPQELRDTYRQYITRKFTQPYKAKDVKWFEQCMAHAPEGFRE